MTFPKNDIHYEKAYVVRVSRTQRVLRAVGVLFLLFVLPATTYLATNYYLGIESRKLAVQLDQQNLLLVELRRQIGQVEQKAANAEMASEIDRNSMEQLRQEILQSEEQIQMLGQQISFYQSLMDPSPQQRGVYLESLDIKPANAQGEYQYNIIVAQRSSNHQRVSGYVNLQLIGASEGEVSQTISLAELTEDQDTLPLGFKFFQQLDGNIRLPEGFIPSRVRVVVQINGDNAPRVYETYEWNS
jgi:hypothetical protein